MRIKNVVKVMNFHSLLRVDASKREAESYRNVGDEITKIIKTIVYNKNLVLDKKVIMPNPNNNKLNIYIANDYGFCGNFNSQIARQIRQDKDDYKIIIGKKIVYNDDKVILKINKDDFSKELKKIEKTIDEAIRNSSYSEIIYIIIIIILVLRLNLKNLLYFLLILMENMILRMILL